ncbi:hypothetical protein Tco_0168906 [Tanacetum coccineum]
MRWIKGEEGTSVDWQLAMDGEGRGGEWRKNKSWVQYDGKRERSFKSYEKKLGNENSPPFITILSLANNNVEHKNIWVIPLQPRQMRLKVEDRIRKKGRDFHKPKHDLLLLLSFSPVGSNIWFKLYGPPSDPDVDLIGTSWYLMGRLGAYNSSNLQANTSMEYNPLYDADKGFNVMPSSFHDVGDVEFQDNWGRVWVDIGTSDYFALDVLLNCLTVLSIWVQSMGDWEEGMKNPEDGYKSFKI